MDIARFGSDHSSLVALADSQTFQSDYTLATRRDRTTARRRAPDPRISRRIRHGGLLHANLLSGHASATGRGARTGTRANSYRPAVAAISGFIRQRTCLLLRLRQRVNRRI